MLIFKQAKKLLSFNFMKVLIFKMRLYRSRNDVSTMNTHLKKDIGLHPEGGERNHFQKFL